MTRRLILTAVCCLAIAGCVNSPQIREAITPPTVGQELMDAWRAVGEGALTEAQYLALKQKLLSMGRAF